MQIETCLDLQQLPLSQLTDQFGKMGSRFYCLCRGIDDRVVEPESGRKSLSVEITFPQDLKTLDECLAALPSLIHELEKRLIHASNLPITKQFIKITFCDFKKTTAETVSNNFTEQLFFELFKEGFKRQSKPIRLLGAGVRFNLSRSETS